VDLSATQFEVLRALAAHARSLRVPELAEQIGADQSPITAACETLRQHGLVQLSEIEFQEVSLGREGLPYVSAPLPERVIVQVLQSHGGRCRITDIPQHCDLRPDQVGQTLRWLAQRGWASKSGEDLVLGDHAQGRLDPQPDEKLLAALHDGRAARLDVLEHEGVPVAQAVELLGKRRGFLNVKTRTDRFVSITDAGRQLLQEGPQVRRQVTQLTPELLAEGGWREVALQPYDVTLAARKLYPGKEHPFQRTLDRVRRVFLELGFTEIASPWVESSFWDFDALFQPQDHPARDMQDTFYVARPDRCRLPDEALVERVRATHETGGNSGSTGWGYCWSRDLAHKPVLRTHTTAATIRALAAHAERPPDPSAVQTGAPRGAASRPGKYFVIGPVFRRETVDYKHLPVFHQVDGIIIDPKASLATLLGTLGAFYGKMGFSKVRFAPSFFPYTEPSAEVLLYFDARQEWVEMGGSGIFRPEVTRPLGITDRVLAWGLGLERLAMMLHGLSSIGELYFATMPWLRETPLRGR
jgi:phenylalanyl-tRNA synthetase alpha chain